MILSWKKKINKLNPEPIPNDAHAHECSMSKDTNYAEIEIYKGVCSYQKYLLEKLDTESLILRVCKNYPLQKETCGCIDSG